VLYRNIWIEPLELAQPNTDLIEPGTPEIPTPTTQPRLERINFKSALDGTNRQYFLYLPKDFDGVVSKKYPVLMFLHGNGERGNGLDELDFVLMHGPLYEAWVQKRDLPFIIISPQLPMFGMDKQGFDYIDNRRKEQIPQRLAQGVPPRNNGFAMPNPMTGGLPVDTFPNGMKTLPVGWDMIETDLKMMLDNAHNYNNGDRDRTYLTGLSYGGFGTWHFASSHPNYFAAIAPVVGWGHPDFMTPISSANMPVWAFAGGLDPVVPICYFYAGLNRLKALGCPDLRFTVHEDMGHEAWLRVYGGQDLYDWFLSHRKH
jgi:predicted peptidase